MHGNGHYAIYVIGPWQRSLTQFVDESSRKRTSQPGHPFVLCFLNDFRRYGSRLIIAERSPMFEGDSTQHVTLCDVPLRPVVYARQIHEAAKTHELLFWQHPAATGRAIPREYDINKISEHWFELFLVFTIRAERNGEFYPNSSKYLPAAKIACFFHSTKYLVKIIGNEE